MINKTFFFILLTVAFVPSAFANPCYNNGLGNNLKVDIHLTDDLLRNVVIDPGNPGAMKKLKREILAMPAQYTEAYVDVILADLEDLEKKVVSGKQQCYCGTPKIKPEPPKFSNPPVRILGD